MEHELLKKKSRKNQKSEDVNEDFKPQFCCGIVSLKKQLQELWSC